MQIKDILDIDLAEYQRATGKVYDACALADELMRRYDPCPPRIVLNARLVIARASVLWVNTKKLCASAAKWLTCA